MLQSYDNAVVATVMLRESAKNRVKTALIRAAAGRQQPRFAVFSVSEISCNAHQSPPAFLPARWLL
jgi:hypothetical protein